MGEVTERDVIRFWSKVERRGPDDCWPWRGATDGRYGQFSVKGRRFKASRVALSLVTGVSLNTEKLACHKCDNPPCCNPAHLFWGTMSDNIRDAINKGRCGISRMIEGNANRRKTHCKRGHELAGENLRVLKSGKRACRTCQREHQHKYQTKPEVADRRLATQRDRYARAALSGSKP